MKRRNFLKNISKASLAPFFLNGLAVREMASSSLKELASLSNNDRVLVLIQLHGGNDGLNTLVPLNQYSQYQALRSNIALSQSGTRKLINLQKQGTDQHQIGLHPDMTSFQQMYDQGMAAIVQGVGYDHMNGSHFRSRDIWLMGGGYQDSWHSGWCGRYLNASFPGYPEHYPNQEMPDPPALEIGNSSTLAFHSDEGVSTALNLEDPEKFYELVSNVGNASAPGAEEGYYGDELSYLMGVEEQSNEYASRLQHVFKLGRNSPGVSYPEKYKLKAPAAEAQNKLSVQLKTIARLLSGGSRTRVFLARINGFDTHAHQVEGSDASMGSHAALLYNLFSAIEAFQKDLKGLGLDDKVLTVTFSEFGRRPASNGSLGTDHGTAAPMFVFGKHVNGGVIGDNPSLTDLDQGKNLKHQYDYRQVFGTLLSDWMLSPSEAIRASRFEDFIAEGKKIPLIAGSAEGAPPAAPAPSPTPESPDEASALEGGHKIYSCHPNPARDYVVVRYRMEDRLPHQVYIRDISGNIIKRVNRLGRDYGDKDVTFNLGGQKAGIYFSVLEVGNDRQVVQFIKR
jgi:uncharacterized protein (DUF1501 family)